MKIKHGLAAAAGASAALAAYAFVVEPRWLQLRHARIHIRSLPPPFEGLRIGLLSDLHIQAGREPTLVRRAVRAIGRAEPELVAVTGDLAEDDDGLQAVLDALSPLAPELGVYAVPGNHDHRAGIQRWHQAVAARKGIRDLTNQYALVEREGATLCVAGIDDHIEGSPRLRLPPPANRDLTILMAHSPDQAEKCRRAYDAVDLILSGHTHGGQVRIPFIGAPVSSADHPDLYEDGLRRRPWTQVYTSRGLGTTRLPVRFMARPEVAILELTRGPRPPLASRWASNRAGTDAPTRPYWNPRPAGGDHEPETGRQV